MTSLSFPKSLITIDRIYHQSKVALHQKIQRRTQKKAKIERERRALKEAK